MQVRDAFPMLKTKIHGNPLIYLDSAATTQKPQEVIDRITRFYTTEYATVHRAVYSLAEKSTEEYQRVRSSIAAFIGSREEEVIFTRGTTDGLNLLAFSLGESFLQKGDEILISEIEHHSNIVPWQMAAKRSGAILRPIPVLDSGDLDLDALKHLLSAKTKIVSIAHISNTVGTVHPIATIAKIVKELSPAVFVVDGAQGIAHKKIDVNQLGCDFYVFSSHKMYGPTGIGILFGRYELLDKLPPYQGGGDMIETVKFDESTYQKTPLKFEAGTPMIAEVIGLGAAIEFLNKIGMNQIAKDEKELSSYAEKKLLEIPGLSLLGHPKERAGIFSFSIDGVHPLDIGMLLDLKGVAIRTGHLCSQPTMNRFDLKAVARASLGVYTTREEIDRFTEHLNHAIRMVKGS